MLFSSIIEACDFAWIYFLKNVDIYQHTLQLALPHSSVGSRPLPLALQVSHPEQTFVCDERMFMSVWVLKQTLEIFSNFRMLISLKTSPEDSERHSNLTFGTFPVFAVVFIVSTLQAYNNRNWFPHDVCTYGHYKFSTSFQPTTLGSKNWKLPTKPTKLLACTI